LKLRRDLVFLSSMLFTVALAIPVPTCISAARTTTDLIFQALGFTCLANILVGLLVIWTGFIKRSRTAWFVMFIIVWVGAFPALVLPILGHKLALTFTEWIYSAIGQSGMPRTWALSVLTFALMAIALFLPVKSFFWNRHDRHGA
jgi:hypothetical protein